MHLKIISVLILFLFFISSATAVDYPSPVGYVNDFADMLDPAEETTLRDEIVAIEKATTVEIAIVTIDSLQSVTIEEYAVKLFERWGIGKKSNDNGLLIFVAKNEREYRIETGYGLEGTINAARAGRMGREIIEPNFKNGEYGKGLYEVLLEVEGLVRDDPSVVARYESSSQATYDLVFGSIISLLIIVLGIILFEFYNGRIMFDVYKKNTNMGWSIMLASDAVALMIAYLVHITLFAIEAIICFFIILRYIPAEKYKGWLETEPGYDGRDDDWNDRSDRGGDSRSDDRDFGGFGGGRSGGGGHSGKW